MNTAGSLTRRTGAGPRLVASTAKSRGLCGVWPRSLYGFATPSAHGTAHSVVVCPPCRHARRHTRCGWCVICPSCLAIGRAVLRQVTDLAASIAARLASTWSLRNAPDHERRFAHRAAQGGTGWHRVRCGQSAEGCVNQLLRHGCVAGANVLGCDPRPLGRGSSVL